MNIMVPLDAAAELERAGIARRLPVMRGPALDAVVTVGTDAATLVALLQAPDAVRAFAAWVCGRRARAGDSIELTATRGGRRVHLVVDGDVDVSVVTEFLAKALAGQDG
ncbi:MAG TPA: hypothetical protein VGG25_17255 [Streptosporangiaceae bacterium]